MKHQQIRAHDVIIARTYYALKEKSLKQFTPYLIVLFVFDTTIIRIKKFKKKNKKLIKLNEK